MKRKELSSLLGKWFAFNVYVFMIVSISIIIYSIIIMSFKDIIVGVIFGFFSYFTFGKRVLKSRFVEFDEDYFYLYDGDEIAFNQIQQIEDGKIIYLENEIEKTIFVNPYFPSKKHRLFTKYYKSKKKVNDKL